MSGAQPKAGNIAGVISVTAEINPKAAKTRHDQGWVDEVISDIGLLCERVKLAKSKREVVSIAYLGNIVDVWEKFSEENIYIELGSDQTSLHNPWAGGYYPVGLTFEESNEMMSKNPELFKKKVKESLLRHAEAIKVNTEKGTYFSIMEMHFYWRHHEQGQR